MVSDRNKFKIDGEYYPRQTNQSETVTLSLVGKECVITSAEGKTLIHAPLASIAISSRIEGIAREMTFPDGSIFKSLDNNGLDRLFFQMGHVKTSQISAIEKFRPRLFGFILIAIILIYGIYRAFLPVMVEVAIYATPPQLPAILGKTTFAALDNSILQPTKLPDTEQKRVQSVFQKLTQHTKSGQNGFKLYFRQAPSNIGPNAFALPDGRIVVTDALVELAGQDTDMIAGVLAHEIGHVERKHSLRQIYRAAGTSALIMFVTGDIGELLERVLLEGNVLLSLSYSRHAEAEADLFGVGLMMECGFNPEALARFFELLTEKVKTQSDTDGETIFDTHPGDKLRVAAIRAEMMRLTKAPTEN